MPAGKNNIALCMARGEQSEGKMKKQYLICSGEGEIGRWEVTNPTTEIGIKQRLTKERCHGDRWASAYEVGSELESRYDGDKRRFELVYRDFDNAAIDKDSGMSQDMELDQLQSLGYHF